MKTLFICLLVLSSAGIGKGTIGYSKPGGISILKVDPAISTIGWKAEKTTGTHSGTVKIRSGRLTLRCGQLASGSITADMSTLEVTDLSAPEKQKLENNLKGDNFFDTGKFPQARLDILSANYKSEPSYHFITITGDFILHGITKKIVFTADVSKSTGTDFIARADIVINRRDWDIATKNFKYDTFINTAIHLHVLLQATKAADQITAL